MKRAAVLLLALLASSLAHGQVQATGVPTLDEGGLVALIALVGVVAGVVSRRRKK